MCFICSSVPLTEHVEQQVHLTPAVERHIIYRCRKGEPMEIYKIILGNKTMLEEKDLPVGNFYQYQVKAELAGGLSTEISKLVEVER